MVSDYEVGKRHSLPLLNIFDKNAVVLAAAQVFNLDGSVNEAIDGSLPEKYAGLDRFVARKQIVADFDVLGLLVSVDDHALKVPKGDRSSTVIEPWLTDQWYVSTKPLAEPAIAAVEDGRIQFVPKPPRKSGSAWRRWPASTARPSCCSHGLKRTTAASTSLPKATSSGSRN